MKKYYINLSLILFIAAAFSACNKDDDEPDKYPGVPKGTIVPIAERAVVLTGAEDPNLKATGDVSSDYKFWIFESSKAIVSVDDTICGKNEEHNLLAELMGEFSDIAFAPNGNIVARDGNNIDENYNDWQWDWADADKSGIIIDKYPDLIFEFTALNENQVVYANVQTDTYYGCEFTVITYDSSSTLQKYNHLIYKNIWA